LVITGFIYTYKDNKDAAAAKEAGRDNVHSILLIINPKSNGVTTKKPVGSISATLELS
jgi:hypothetical protein